MSKNKRILLLISLIIFFLLCLILFRSSLITSVIIKAYEKKLETEEVGNIVFQYKENEQETINLLIDKVSEINNLGDEWFGGSNNSTLTVFLPKADSILEKMLGKSNAIFLQNKNIAIINSKLTENEILHALTHEYAHFHMMTNMIELQMEVTDIPEWFHEGVAEAFAHRFAPVPFNQSINQWNVIPFSEMKIRRGHDYSSIGEWYIMSQFTVERLIKDYGEGVILNLIHSTKETESFSLGFFETTGEPLDTYHKILNPDNEFINQVMHQAQDKDNLINIKQSLLDYDNVNGPYYYQADVVYHILESIYVEEQDWEKALSMLKKRMYYNHSSWMWSSASEYALKLNDKEKAFYFAERAKEISEQGDSHFDKIFNSE